LIDSIKTGQGLAAPVRTPIPLIPAKAGTQIPWLGVGWIGSPLVEPTSELIHLGPGLRRDERDEIEPGR